MPFVTLCITSFTIAIWTYSILLQVTKLRISVLGLDRAIGLACPTRQDTPKE